MEDHASDVSFWHLTDKSVLPVFVRFRTTADKKGFRSADGLSAFDPTAILAVRCGNGLDAGFSPYQSNRLNRYNAVS